MWSAEPSDKANIGGGGTTSCEGRGTGADVVVAAAAVGTAVSVSLAAGRGTNTGVGPGTGAGAGAVVVWLGSTARGGSIGSGTVFTGLPGGGRLAAEPWAWTNPSAPSTGIASKAGGPCRVGGVRTSSWLISASDDIVAREGCGCCGMAGVTFDGVWGTCGIARASTVAGLGPPCSRRNVAFGRGDAGDAGIAVSRGGMDCIGMAS